MPITIVVIGRNAEPTLRDCFASVREMLRRYESDLPSGHAFASESQVLYVDGGSSDASVRAAQQESKIEIVRIVRSDRFTAALGRHVGLRHARHDVVLFMDADMRVSPTWIMDSLETVVRLGCVTGRWEEICVAGDGAIRSRHANHNRIEHDGPLKQPTGFLMIDRRVVGHDCQFSPLVINNEEKDFVSQFAAEAAPWQIARPGFEHHNVRFGRRLKWRAFRSLTAKTGPWVSLLQAAADRRLSDYRRLQPGKLGIVAGWGCVTVAAAIAPVQWRLTAACLLLAMAFIVVPAKSGRRRSQILDAAFFPYKFSAAIWLLIRGGTADVESDEGSYRLCLRSGKVLQRDSLRDIAKPIAVAEPIGPPRSGPTSSVPAQASPGVTLAMADCGPETARFHSQSHEEA